MPLPNGSRIRARREELDLRPAQLAERLGISAGYLRNIESGHDPIRNEVGHRIARALAISFEDVMGTNPVPPLAEGTNDGVPDEPPKQPKPQKAPPKRQGTERTTGPRRAAEDAA